ncbi:hypothetical protein ACFWBB_26535 [Streptomyces sp. NPDC060000]|uniref:hypothetical protein n=1 Tax=Streptomyces sp. NPDC060000 TaxID=3347031 RepID=UPI0036BB6D9C
MRLQLVPDDEIDDWDPWRPSAPRLRPSASSRLNALRRSFYEDALSAIGPGRPIRVATYVFAARGVDVDAAHAMLAEHARDRGWTVHRDRFTDEPTGGPLPARPQFNRACRHAGSGFADGVLASGRGAMPTTDEAYESYLRWLRDRYAFLAFQQPAIGGTPWTDR